MSKKMVTIKPFHGEAREIPWQTFLPAMARFEINHEDWACSDYARRFHGFVAYLRHFSDGEFSSFGQFTTPFVVLSADVPLGDDIGGELESFLRADAFLWYAVQVMKHRKVNGTVTTSGSFANEWFVTTALNVDDVLRDRGFPL